MRVGGEKGAEARAMNEREEGIDHDQIVFDYREERFFGAEVLDG
jgi:hypothetical protein